MFGTMQYHVIVKSVSPLEAGIGYRTFSQINVTHGNLIIHFIDEVLPELRPSQGCLEKFAKAKQLGNDNLTLMFEENNIPKGGTLVLQLIPTSGEDISLLTSSNVQWTGQNTTIDCKLPNPNQKVKFTVKLFIAEDNQKIVYSRHWAYLIEIHPNPELQNKCKILDINPQSGCENTKLWIFGTNFSPKSEVYIDDVDAVIYKATAHMIMCIVPKLTKTELVHISVKNGNRRVNSPQKFHYLSS